MKELIDMQSNHYSDTSLANRYAVIEKYRLYIGDYLVGGFTVSKIQIESLFVSLGNLSSLYNR